MMLHLTPAIEEVLYTRVIRCSIPNCDSIFSNAGNYDMHMKRHHKVQPKRDEAQRRFYCPQEGCRYHNVDSTDKHFKSMKCLRQHYQKVHAPKVQKCEKCGKGFATATQLDVHIQKLCGVKFPCQTCGWQYSSREALLTHCKRKGHLVSDASHNQFINKNTQIKCEPKHYQHQETQTDDTPSAKCRWMDISTDEHCVEPDTKSRKMEPQELLENGELPLPRNIETQTDYPFYIESSNNNSNSVLPSLQLLPPFSHMQTQTYDDIFSDTFLGFTDIQTQTNWSSLTAASEVGTAAGQYTTGVGTCTRSAYDELLVSTETQTSFTQCLLDSRTASGDAEDGAFSSLYQTQHTQTCDMLLEGLFGGQESDLIGSFQSTYTQT